MKKLISLLAVITLALSNILAYTNTPSIIINGHFPENENRFEFVYNSTQTLDPGFVVSVDKDFESEPLTNEFQLFVENYQSSNSDYTFSFSTEGFIKIDSQGEEVGEHLSNVVLVSHFSKNSYYLDSGIIFSDANDKTIDENDNASYSFIIPPGINYSTNIPAFDFYISWSVLNDIDSLPAGDYKANIVLEYTT